MQLDKIITLANRKVYFRFMALERSLRATGCTLPLWVIPYDGEIFDLPENASWWSMPEIQDWLQAEKLHPMCRKFQCLTAGHYQFVDTDVVFLRNPEQVLAEQTGFITSCGHWRDPTHTVTPASAALLRGMSSVWQQRVFNAGQFACDRALYSVEELKRTCHDPRYAETCLGYRFHDEPALNLLVNLSGAPIYNLTLPPVAMESTWAGDYAGPDYAATWTSEKKKPYLMHWAGCNGDVSRPINRLYLDYLTASERGQLEAEMTELSRRCARERRSLRSCARRSRFGLQAFAREWRK